MAERSSDISTEKGDIGETKKDQVPDGFNAEFFHAVPKGIPGNVEQFGSLSLVSFGSLQRCADGLFFQYSERKASLIDFFHHRRSSNLLLQ